MAAAILALFAFLAAWNAAWVTSLLLLPTTAASFSAQGGDAGFMGAIAAYLGRGQPLYLIIFASLIAFFVFFYTAVVFNPDDVADNLKKYGGFIPGIRAGKKTAEYIDRVLTRITFGGAV